MRNILNFSKSKTDYTRKSYAQEGEDLLLDRYINGQKEGFFVDVGAHHPQRFSNTYLLYKRGWSGINIEPTPGKMKLFNKIRARDINLEVAVGSEEKMATFHLFNESALNTFNPTVAEKIIQLPEYKLEKTLPIKIIPLKKILDLYFPKNKTFDLLTIDAEGNDLDVLLSNDWALYKPRYILVEGQNGDIRSALDSPITQFLAQQKYIARAKTFNTLLFSLDSEN